MPGHGPTPSRRYAVRSRCERGRRPGRQGRAGLANPTATHIATRASCGANRAATPTATRTVNSGGQGWRAGHQASQSPHVSETPSMGVSVILKIPPSPSSKCCCGGHSSSVACQTSRRGWPAGVSELDRGHGQGANASVADVNHYGFGLRALPAGRCSI